MSTHYKQLNKDDLKLVEGILDCFGDAFDDEDSYCRNRPDASYLRELLSGESLIAIAALNNDGRVVGGLTAYELKKIEQPRSEIYIYDLAVAEGYRRQGIATALISKLQPIAVQRSVWVIYVQADFGDEPATRLYQSLGVREQVLHFDIPVVKK